MVLAVAVVAALIAVDAAASPFYRTDNTASLVSVPPRSGRLSTLMVIFPGYLMPAADVGRAFAPHLDAATGLLIIQYAERGVDPEAIRNSLVPQFRNLAPERIVFYGASMGGMCAYDVLRRLSSNDVPISLVLDTAPASREDVRRPAWSFAFAPIYRGGPLASGIWRALANLPATHPVPEPATDPDIIANSRRRYATVGMPAVTSQAEYIGTFALLPPAQQPVRVGYLRASDSAQDPLVKVDQAIARWRTVYPALVTEEIEGRRGEWHIPLVERPAETIEAITRVVSL